MNMLSEALTLAIQRGFAVFPVTTPSHGGPNAGKRPLIKGWQDLATTSGEIIQQWWSQWPDANIGIATGNKSNVFVLDVDLKSGGVESLDRLMNDVGQWPDTMAARTGSGGFHFYFRYDGLSIRNSASDLAPGLDIRGEGGFVVAPPSIHVSGNRYQWLS